MISKPVGMSIVLLAVAGLVIYGTIDSAAQQPGRQAQQTVRAANLGKTVQLIGRLGKPMTEAVEITGHWEDRGFTKASRYVFVVTAVAGRSLDPPAEFNRYVVSIDGDAMTDSDVALDETWTCKAIELGRFRNVLEKNWELFYEAPVAPPRWGEGPFVSEIILSKRTLSRKAPAE